MKFPYSSIITAGDNEQDFLLVQRPEIPVDVAGPNRAISVIGLVDTGSDNTIFPKSLADALGIELQPSPFTATSFGGFQVSLMTGEVVLKLTSGQESLEWATDVCFFEFESTKDECVLLGHAGFLEYLTATFSGDLAELELVTNDSFPGHSKR